MNISDFYNNFHKKSKVSGKLIDNKNFTYEIILDVINEELLDTSKKINILDYGCGSGSLSLYLSSLGFKVHGYDISLDAIKICHGNAKILNDTRVKFANQLPKKSKRYDLILCIEVIEHIHKDSEFIDQLRKLLKKNGKIILSTPSINSPLYRLGLLKKFDKEVGHIRRYDIKTLEKIFIENNFLIKKIIAKEGILRNSLYTIKSLGFLIKFIRWPLSKIVNYFDNLLVPIFGESDLILVAIKR